jgi:uncharacterized protein (DUF305 family)
MPLAQSRLVAPAVLALTLSLMGCGSSTSDHDRGAAASPAASSSTPSATGTASPAPSSHNDGDVLFAQQMIPHHNQAIAMSKLLLAKSDVDPQVAALARRIKDAQGPEVAQMTGWLSGWGEDPGAGSMGGTKSEEGSMGGMDHGAGDGMMSEADMDALRAADGAKATTLFLNGMIEHHAGAITMAEAELEQGSDPDARELAQVIIDAQRAEIGQMKKLRVK